MSDQHSIVYYWRCPNCGQVHFGETPPDMCAFCDDFTTWEALSDAFEPPVFSDSTSTFPRASDDDATPSIQLPLFDD